MRKQIDKRNRAVQRGLVRLASEQAAKHRCQGKGRCSDEAPAFVSLEGRLYCFRHAPDGAVWRPLQ